MERLLIGEEDSPEREAFKERLSQDDILRMQLLKQLLDNHKDVSWRRRIPLVREECYHLGITTAQFVDMFEDADFVLHPTFLFRELLLTI